MIKTLVVCGHGIGISNAVADTFARQGYDVALVARNKEALEAAATALAKASGRKVYPVDGDLATTDGVKSAIASARRLLGSISVLHWNVTGFAAGDLTTATDSELRWVLELGVVSLNTAMQEALADLKKNKGALLVTGGGLSTYGPQIDQMAASYNIMGGAIAKAAQRKLVGMLHEKLKPDGVFVGEVIVNTFVKGTKSDPDGKSSVSTQMVADKFWDIFTSRSKSSVEIG